VAFRPPAFSTACLKIALMLVILRNPRCLHDNFLF
jgi:hypothetical protein